MMPLEFDTDYEALRTPWVVEGVSPSLWLKCNWESFVKHPSQIVAASLPILEFWHRPYDEGGVYFLLLNGQITYVGMTVQSVEDRIESHSRNKAFDAVSVIPIPWGHHYVEMVESLYIEWLKPWDNVRKQRTPKPFKRVADLLTESCGDADPFVFRGLDDDQGLPNIPSPVLSKNIHAAARSCVAA